jgi:hypothetical protein
MTFRWTIKKNLIWWSLHRFKPILIRVFHFKQWKCMEFCCVLSSILHGFQQNFFQFFTVILMKFSKKMTHQLIERSELWIQIERCSLLTFHLFSSEFIWNFCKKSSRILSWSKMFKNFVESAKKLTAEFNLINVIFLNKHQSISDKEDLN